jgi:hypothetical protein
LIALDYMTIKRSSRWKKNWLIFYFYVF